MATLANHRAMWKNESAVLTHENKIWAAETSHAWGRNLSSGLMIPCLPIPLGPSLLYLLDGAFERVLNPPTAESYDI